jgi:hypothetical protein
MEVQPHSPPPITNTHTHTPLGLDEMLTGFSRSVSLGSSVQHVLSEQHDMLCVCKHLSPPPRLGLRGLQQRRGRDGPTGSTSFGPHRLHSRGAGAGGCRRGRRSKRRTKKHNCVCKHLSPPPRLGLRGLQQRRGRLAPPGAHHSALTGYTAEERVLYFVLLCNDELCNLPLGLAIAGIIDTALGGLLL